MGIRENWQKFQQNVVEAAQKYSVPSEGIDILTVSKTRSVEEIREAITAGIHLFGENRVEEGASKFSQVNQDTARLFFIGHLQSNKVNQISARFSGVHSVDSLKIAERLSRYRSSIEAPLEVLIQVNTSGEESKSGIGDRSLFREIAHAVTEMPALELKGLMTMAPFVDDERVVRNCFSACREWSKDVSGLINGEAILSMGMSSDYQWAIAEGSNMLRIGTALFAS